MSVIKKNIFFLLRIVVSFGLLFALFKIVPYKKIIDIYLEADKFYLIIGFLVAFLGYVFAIFRWHFFLSVIGVKATIKDVAIGYICGLFFNLFIPSLVGGDIFRGIIISQEDKAYGKVFSSVLIDRYNGIFILLIIACISYLFLPPELRTKDITIVIIILAIGIIFFTIFLVSPQSFRFLTKFIQNTRLKDKIDSFYNNLNILVLNRRVFLRGSFYSLMVQFTTVLSLYIFTLSLSNFYAYNFLYFFVYVPLIMICTFLPITIGGLGTREAAALYFFSQLGMSHALAMGVSFLHFLVLLSGSIIGGIIYVMVYHRWMESKL